jgi:predicted CXXCH cytochrome family protein
MIVGVIFFTSFTNAQTRFYLGTGNETSAGMDACAACHRAGAGATPQYDSWKNTKHATAHTALVSNTSYGYACLSCHNTGWDATTTNYGADEYVTQSAGTPDYTITDQPNFDRVKNVGCESCHGALGDANRMLNAEHWGFGTTNKPDYSAQVCGKCHQGAHNPYFEEWNSTGHAISANQTMITGNAACVKCHVAQNFIAYVENPTTYRDTILVTGDEIKPITCVACHNPHGNSNPSQLRLPITGAKVICDACHTVGTETVNINSTPHHTTSEALTGTTNFGFQYSGQTYENSLHSLVATERCINCHIKKTTGTTTSTGHTFKPSVVACATCHPDYYTAVDTSNHATRFNYRGMQSTTDSLIAILSAKLNAASGPDSLTDAFKQSNYNLLSCQNEGSRGIHNTKLVQKLLRDAIINFTPTAIKETGSIPTRFNLDQNYPNPFNPSTTIQFAIPERALVTLKIYDVSGKLIAVIQDGELEAGNYKSSFNGAGLASGIYFYKLEAGNYSSIKKFVLMK